MHMKHVFWGMTGFSKIGQRGEPLTRRTAATVLATAAAAAAAVAVAVVVVVIVVPP